MKRGFASPFVLADHAAFGGPAFARAVLEVGERARRPPRALRLGAGLPHLGGELGSEAAFAGEPEPVFHVVSFAPGHQVIAAEAAVGADHDARPRPALAHLRNDA